MAGPGQKPKPGPKPGKAPKAPEKAKKPSEKKEKTAIRTSEKLASAFGGGFVLQVKETLKWYGKFIAALEGIGVRIEDLMNEQDPVKQSQMVEKWKSKIKVPPVKNPKEKLTKIEQPKTNEKLPNYLLRCLGIKQPDLKKIQPPTKELKMAHVSVLLERTYISKLGRSAIVDGFKDKVGNKTKVPTFYKGDLILFKSKFSEDVSGGFVEEINDKEVTIKTIENGVLKTVKKRTYDCLIAFHIPGNKVKGPAYAPKKKEKKKKPKPKQN